MKKIYTGADHAGYELKNELKKYILALGFEVEDIGTFSSDPVDYPDIAQKVAGKIVKTRGAFGILICGTGLGMCMAANRFRGVRAADCTNEIMAEFARKHNNANVLCLGALLIKLVLAKKIVKKFLEANFELSARHIRRVKKIDNRPRVKHGVSLLRPAEAKK